MSTSGGRIDNTNFIEFPDVETVKKQFDELFGATKAGPNVPVPGTSEVLSTGFIEKRATGIVPEVSVDFQKRFLSKFHDAFVSHRGNGTRALNLAKFIESPLESTTVETASKLVFGSFMLASWQNNLGKELASIPSESMSPVDFLHGFMFDQVMFSLTELMGSAFFNVGDEHLLLRTQTSTAPLVHDRSSISASFLASGILTTEIPLLERVFIDNSVQVQSRTVFFHVTSAGNLPSVDIEWPIDPQAKTASANINLVISHPTSLLFLISTDPGSVRKDWAKGVFQVLSKMRADDNLENWGTFTSAQSPDASKWGVFGEENMPDVVASMPFGDDPILKPTIQTSAYIELRGRFQKDADGFRETQIWVHAFLIPGNVWDSIRKIDDLRDLSSQAWKDVADSHRAVPIFPQSINLKPQALLPEATSFPVIANRMFSFPPVDIPMVIKEKRYDAEINLRVTRDYRQFVELQSNMMGAMENNVPITAIADEIVKIATTVPLAINAIELVVGFQIEVFLKRLLFQLVSAIQVQFTGIRGSVLPPQAFAIDKGQTLINTPDLWKVEREVISKILDHTEAMNLIQNIVNAQNHGISAKDISEIMAGGVLASLAFPVENAQATDPNQAILFSQLKWGGFFTVVDEFDGGSASGGNSQSVLRVSSVSNFIGTTGLVVQSAIKLDWVHMLEKITSTEDNSQTRPTIIVEDQVDDLSERLRKLEPFLPELVHMQTEVLNLIEPRSRFLAVPELLPSNHLAVIWPLWALMQTWFSADPGLSLIARDKASPPFFFEDKLTPGMSLIGSPEQALRLLAEETAAVGDRLIEQADIPIPAAISMLETTTTIQPAQISAPNSHSQAISTWKLGIDTANLLVAEAIGNWMQTAPELTLLWFASLDNRKVDQDFKIIPHLTRVYNNLVAQADLLQKIGNRSSKTTSLHTALDEIAKTQAAHFDHPSIKTSIEQFEKMILAPRRSSKIPIKVVKLRGHTGSSVRAPLTANILADISKESGVAFQITDPAEFLVWFTAARYEIFKRGHIQSDLVAEPIILASCIGLEAAASESIEKVRFEIDAILAKNVPVITKRMTTDEIRSLEDEAAIEMEIDIERAAIFEAVYSQHVPITPKITCMQFVKQHQDYESLEIPKTDTRRDGGFLLHFKWT